MAAPGCVMGGATSEALGGLLIIANVIDEERWTFARGADVCLLIANVIDEERWMLARGGDVC